MAIDMTNYLTKDDYKKVITADDLAVVEQQDDLALEDAEEAAIEYFKGYLRSRYNVEWLFSQTGDKRDKNLVKFLGDQVLYDLHATLPGNMIPEIRIIRKKELDAWLKAIQTGQYQPDWLLIGQEEGSGTGGNTGSDTGSEGDNPYFRFGSIKKHSNNW